MIYVCFVTTLHNMNANPFYTWCRKEGFWGASGDAGAGKAFTHLLLDGGKLTVPSSRITEFNLEYAKHVVQRDLFVVEVRPERFRMFMDLDFKTPDAVRAAETDEAVRTLSTRLYSVYLEYTKTAAMHSGMVVCSRQLIGDTGESGPSKFGVHLVWPDWIVSREVALDFRAHAIRACSHDGMLGIAPAQWNDIIDLTVYKGSGLRMIASKKYGDRTNIYVPTYEIDAADGTMQQINNPWAGFSQWVLKTSLRQAEALAPESALSRGVVCQPGDVDHGELPSTLVDSSVFEFDDRALQVTFKNTHLTPVPMTPAIRQFLKEIQALFPVCYARCKLTKLYHFMVGKDDAFVIATDSKFCMNLRKNKGRHNSNHVYFVLNKTGVWQKCFSRCETSEGRKWCPCKDFKGRVVPFVEANVGKYYSPLVTLYKSSVE